MQLQVLQKTEINEKGKIAVTPICKMFEMNVQSVHRTMKKDHILSDLWTKESTNLGYIEKNGTVWLSKRGFVRWIQNINPKYIKDQFRESFKNYQRLIFDYLYGKEEDYAKVKTNAQNIERYEQFISKAKARIKEIKSENNLILSGTYSVQLKLL